MSTPIKTPITAAGYAKLEAKLMHLKTQERPQIIDAIQAAREHGDLSENADYSASKDKQSFIEGAIKDLEAKLGMCEIIKHAPANSRDDPDLKIKFGATVTFEDTTSGKRSKYTIVSEDEADINDNLLSILSKLAQAMIGCSADEEFEVEDGGKVYRVLEIEYK